MPTLPEHLSSKPAGQEQLPREVMEDHQREHILSAVAQVFSERGYRGTTVDDLIEAANVGVGSFYSLFDGKEGCFLGALERALASAREGLPDAQEGDADWAARVCTLLRALLGLAASDPVSARVVLLEAPAAGPVARQLYEDTFNEIASVLRQGRDLDSAADLPETLEVGLVGGIAWLLQQRIADGDAGEIPDLFPDAAGFALAPYLGEAEARKLIEVADG